jgi:DNA-directed RNA polymerase subunit RPC12/RpoP
MSWWTTQIVAKKYLDGDLVAIADEVSDWLIKERIAKRTTKERIFDADFNFWKMHLEKYEKADYSGFLFSELKINLNKGFHFAHPMDISVLRCRHCRAQFGDQSQWITELQQSSMITCQDCGEQTNVFDIKYPQETFGFSNFSIELSNYSADIQLRILKNIESIIGCQVKVLYQNF